MTTPQLPPRGRTGLPVVAASGQLADGGASYAFSARADGTMSTQVGDGDVGAARALLAARTGVDAGDVAWMHQVHGTRVAMADDVSADPGPPACDGIVRTSVGRAVGVLVADCVPVLLHAPGGVAAAHAGRLGVMADVTGATAHRLLEVTAADPGDITAIIGPAIGPCCYEVPEEIAEDVQAAVPGLRTATTWGTPSVDLVAGVVQQLRRRAVTAIASAGGCTRCDGDGWFSHRAARGPESRPAGRQAGIIALTAADVAGRVA